MFRTACKAGGGNPWSSLRKQIAIDHRVIIVVVPCVSASGPQEIVDNKISYFTTEAVTAGKVKAEMLSREDTTQRRFFGGGREVRKRAQASAR